MSGIKKSVGKVFKKIRKSKILTAVVIAAAVWYTAGVASAYMAAPQAGMGAAMSASGSSMWATATTGSFVSGAQVAQANVAMAASGTQTAAAITAEFGVEGAALTDAGLASAGGAEAAALTDAGLASAGGAEAAGVASSQALASTEGAGIVNSAANGNIMSNNPMATMVLGQAGVGAYSSYEQRRMEEKRIKEDKKIRRERGAMGADYYGTDYSVEKSQPAGIVNSQSVATQQTAAQATAAPVVTPQNRPIDKKNLPKLSKQGLIAPQRVA